MIKIFGCYKDEKLFYMQFVDGITLSDHLFIIKYFESHIIKFCPIYTIFDFIDNAYIKDLEFISASGKFTYKNISKFKGEKIIGITGVKKFFFKIYKKFLPDSYESIAFETREEFEQKNNIDLIEDFYLIATNIPDKI